MPNPSLSKKQREDLLRLLQARFEKNLNRHKGLAWADVQAKLQANAEKLWSLSEMERTGGEPDVVKHDKKTGEYVFYDCSEQSPKGRRSLCYDREALQSRKEHKPKNSATFQENERWRVNQRTCRQVYFVPPALDFSLSSTSFCVRSRRVFHGSGSATGPPD